MQRIAIPHKPSGVLQGLNLGAHLRPIHLFELGYSNSGAFSEYEEGCRFQFLLILLSFDIVDINFLLSASLISYSDQFGRKLCLRGVGQSIVYYTDSFVERKGS